MTLMASGRTDIGQKRKTNQDSIFLDVSKNLFIVADGMGGHKGGDIASALAVRLIPEYCFNNSELAPQDYLANAIIQTNKKIKSKSETDEKLEGMGTTVVGLYFRKDTAYVFNVGDSRAYLYSQKNLFQLTRDHSLVQEKLNMGIYDREMASKDPQKNVLVRTVGFDDGCDPDIFSYRMKKNDLFLICSDGLHGKVSDEDLTVLFNRYLPSLEEATQEDLELLTQVLIDQANRNGGQDNISVIVVLCN